MKLFLLLTAFCFFAIELFGQTPKTDSLKRLVFIATSDRSRLKAILDLCERSETLPKDTLWNYAMKAKKLSSSIGDTRSMSLAIMAQACAYLRWDNVDSARALIEPEITKYKVEDSQTRDIYFKLHQLKFNCISTVYTFKDAITDIFSVISEAEKYNDSLVMAESMTSLGSYKYEMDFVPEAISWGIKALSFTSNNPRFYAAMMESYGNLSEYYYWIDKLDSATYYANRLLNLSMQAQNIPYQSWAWQKKSAIYIKRKDYDNAQKAILESIQLDQKINGNEPSYYNLIALANVYERKKQFDKAIKVLADGLRYSNNAKNISPHAKNNAFSYGLKKIFYYQELARNYHLQGDSRNYELYLEKIITEMDTFYKANSAQAIADMETKYQVQKKEVTIAQQQLALVRGNYLFYGTLVVLILSGVIIWLIFKEFRRKQQLRLQQLHEEEMLLSAKAVADAEETERRRIAADLHDNLGAQLSFIKRNVNFILDQPAGFSQQDEWKYLTSVNDIAQNAMIDLRETIWVLNKDEINIQEFADKLKSYLKQQLMSNENIQLHFEEDIRKDWKLSSGEVMHLFRIVQEVISNIIKHADADQIDINFASVVPGYYQLEIFDNGNGFDVTNRYEGHYGLENIEQRAKEIFASLSITSDPTSGTHILLQKEKK